jgi:hypothetical protein
MIFKRAEITVNKLIERLVQDRCSYTLDLILIYSTLL